MATYNDPAIPRFSDQLPTATAIDPSGTHVFVGVDDLDAGLDISRWVVLRENAATGDQEWAQAYGGAPDSAGTYSFPQGMAVSPDGQRLYVTGISTGADGAETFTTIAYATTTGNRLWTADYEGPQRVSEGVAVAVAHDGATVYATGATVVDPAGDIAWVTIAYDAVMGTERWIQLHQRANNAFDDLAAGIAVAPDDSTVYVTGSGGGDGQPDVIDIDTVAYAAGAGAQRWSTSYGKRLISEPVGIVASADGSRLFVAGLSTTGPNLGYITLGLDSADGSLTWDQWYLGDLDDSIVFGLAASPSGDTAYVTGFSNASTFEYDNVTIAYEAAHGTQRWLARQDDTGSDDVGMGIGVSGDGQHVYSSGYTAPHNGSGTDELTLRYAAASGALEWTADYSARYNDADGAWELVDTAPGGTGVYTVGPLIHGIDPSATGDFYDTATVAYDVPSGAVSPATVATPVVPTSQCRAVSNLPTPSPNQYPYPQNMPTFDLSAQLLGVTALSGSDVWAAGYEVVGVPPVQGAERPEVRPLFEHFDGTSWSIVPAPAAAFDVAVIGDVAAVSGHDVWAVGYEFDWLQPAGVPTGLRPLIEHYDGSAWAVVPDDPAATGDFLQGVAAFGSGDVWAVGGSESSTSVREHWNGLEWQLSAGPGGEQDTELIDVAGSGSSDVWTVGQGGEAEHWNGSSWSRLAIGDVNDVFTGVAVIGPADAWASGAGGLEHWNGSVWARRPDAAPARSDPLLIDVTAAGSHDVWAGGVYRDPLSHDGAPLVEHFDGTSWTQLRAAPESGDVDVYDSLAVLPDDTLFGVGGYGFFVVQPLSGEFTPRPAGSQLCLDIVPSLSAIETGAIYTYTVTVHNWGSASADGVNLVNTLPSGATLRSVAASEGACTSTSDTVSCAIGTVAPLHDGVVTIEVAAGPPGTEQDSAIAGSAGAGTTSNDVSVTIEPRGAPVAAVPEMPWTPLAVTPLLMVALVHRRRRNRSTR